MERIQPITEFDKTLDAIADVEALPFRRSFEQIMRDHKILEKTTYESTDPIEIPTILTLSCVSPELRPFLGDGDMTITEIAARLCTDSDELSVLDIAMSVNGVDHALSSGGGKSTYTIDGYAGSHSYTISEDAGASLLGTLVYATQYDQNDPEKPLELSGEILAINRDPRAAQIEQLLTTLGHFNGQVKTVIESLFETNSGPLLAKLVIGEDTLRSFVQSKLGLSFHYPQDNLESYTSLLQNAATTTCRLETRFAEKYETAFSADPLTLIDPIANHDEWAHACCVFGERIKPHLEMYAYLDED